MPANFATSINANKTLEPKFLSTFWTVGKPLSTANRALYDTEVEKIGTYLATLSGRVWLVLEPEFNNDQALRTDAAFSSVMQKAMDAVRAKVAGKAGLTLVVGQGVALHHPLASWSSEFVSMSTTSLSHCAKADFVALTLRATPPAMRQLQQWPCVLRATTQWLNDTFRVQSIAIVDVTVPLVDFEWGAAFIRAIDDLSGDAAGLYYAGLRAFVIRPDVICAPGQNEGACIAVR